MDMILVDWTRMGKTYCLAGVVSEAGRYRVVRPLRATGRTALVRNVGWTASLWDGHARWEIFELIRPEPAEPLPPHTEDLWVAAARPRRRSATASERQAILAATTAHAGESLFGAALTTTRVHAYLKPGEGRRSLVTILVPAGRIWFDASQRDGVAEPDVRVTLPVPGMHERTIAVKDHHLLLRAEQGNTAIKDQVKWLNETVHGMGPQVAVRLGLSRAFQADTSRGAACWLMADGFFSLGDP